MMHFGKLSAVAFVVGSFRHIALAQNITAATCASPEGFLTCMGVVVGALDNCLETTVPCDDNCKTTCGCGFQTGQLRCALGNCWNVVYGCEYQSIAAELVSYCLASAEDIPFFPPPDDAPGGCSCNLGYISNNITNVVNIMSSCDADSTGNPARAEACLCCSAAGQLTSIYSICSDVSLPYLETLFNGPVLENIISAFPNCAPLFSQFDCVGDLGFPPIAAFSYLTTVPTTTGSLIPSTTGESITSPLFSSIFYTSGSETETITPVAVMNAQPSGSNNPTSSAGGTEYTGSAPRFVSTSAGFLNTQLLVLCTIMLYCWI